MTAISSEVPSVPPSETEATIPDPFGYGEAAVRCLRAMRHPKSRLPGHAFQLDPWQEDIVRRIYGPRKPDGTRIIKTVVLLLPRGNRKTSLAAALILLHTFGPERIPGGEVISAASDRKQARIAFHEAEGIISCTPGFKAISTSQDYKNRIVNARHRTFYEAISADAGTQHGRTPAFVLADELHAWKRRELWDVLRSGMVKTSGSLMVVATTAGRGQENVAFEIVNYARKVANGEIDDPSCLPILFEADRDCDWTDEAVWHKVNPGLAHGYPDIDGLRQLAREARERPGDREAFRQLNLNIWLDHSADPFVDMATYDEGAQPVNLDALEGAPCWLGVDLSSSGDLTSIVAAWRDGESYIVHPWYFCPEENLRARADIDGVPYVTWEEQGFIEATPGTVVDIRRVETVIRDLCDRFDVREIAFDPHYGRVVMSNLLDDSLPVVEMRQTVSTMGPAVTELERAILGRRLIHGGHPILRWNFDNVVVRKTSDGSAMFDKGKKRDRIDGAVACAMAVARASVGEGGSIYDSEEWDPEMMVM